MDSQLNLPVPKKNTRHTEQNYKQKKMLRRYASVMKSVESVLGLEWSLWHNITIFVLKVLLSPNQPALIYL